MNKIDTITNWVLIAMLIITAIQCFMPFDDIRFIRHCSLFTLTISVVTYIEVIRLRRELRGGRHEQT